MKLSNFIVLFVCCVAFFAILLRPQNADARQRQRGLGILLYHEIEPNNVEPQFPEFEEPRDSFDPFASSFPETNSGLETTDWKEALGFITFEIESSQKNNANEIKAHLGSVKAAIDGKPFDATYANEENMFLLEMCVNYVKNFVGYTSVCEKIKAKIAEVRKSI